MEGEGGHEERSLTVGMFPSWVIEKNSSQELVQQGYQDILSVLDSNQERILNER